MKIAACIITKNYDTKAVELVGSLLEHVDHIYVQVNGAKFPKTKVNEKVTFTSFKWVDDFSAARNALHKEMLKGDHDYWIWADTGDTLKGIEDLKGTVEVMRQNEIDVLYCRYNYEKDNLGDTIADQWRERIISTSVEGEWKGAIHETFVPSKPVHHIRDDRIVWVHEDKTEDEKESSRQRNHKILERLVYGDGGSVILSEADPRDIYYLATSYFGYKDFEKAIPLYLDYIKKSGWPEEQYRAWKKIAEAHSQSESWEKALSAYFQCLRIQPKWKDAYLGIAEVYHWQDQDAACLHWLTLSEQAEVPDTLSVVDPTVYTYRPRMMAAVSAARLGKLEHAYRMAKQVEAIQPNYEMVKQYLPIIEEELLDKKAIDQAVWLAKYVKRKKGNPIKIFDALPSSISGHPALLGHIQKYLPVKKWNDKSIVFVCTAGVEAWGPDTLEKGMGGSEEAIVYLSRELAKQGWDVTVYNDREEEYIEEIPHIESADGDFVRASVTWKPWTLFNPADEFNVVIAWRNPNMFKATKIKAKFKGVDMHDTPMGHQSISYPETVDKFFFKSQFQADMSGLPGDKYVIIPNGIKVSQFND